MSFFWARFQQIQDHDFRFDTRVYLTDVNKISEDDICVGAVVGKILVLQDPKIS